MRRELTFKIACAIARAEITRDLSIGDGEWVARMKDTAIRQGYNYPPTPEFWSRVLSAVDRTVQRPLPAELTEQHQEIRQSAPHFSKSEAAAISDNIKRLWKLQKELG
jgi:hypothetical protein